MVSVPLVSPVWLQQGLCFHGDQGQQNPPTSRTWARVGMCCACCLDAAQDRAPLRTARDGLEALHPSGFVRSGFRTIGTLQSRRFEIFNEPSNMCGVQVSELAAFVVFVLSAFVGLILLVLVHSRTVTAWRHLRVSSNTDEYLAAQTETITSFRHSCIGTGAPEP